MTTRRHALLAIAALACGMVPLLGLTSVLAQGAAPDVGWWTSNQVAGVPIGRALLVPPGGSQVAAGADGAVSVAAVRFPAGPDGATYRVGVELGSDTDGITVIACPVTGTWDVVHGAPLSEAPAWDCTLAQAVGTVDIDAGTIGWELPSAFVRDGAVDAMLLPPDAGRAFTLTMAAPDDGSVSPLEPSPTTSPGPTSTTVPAAPRADGTDASPDGPVSSRTVGPAPPRPTVPPGPSPTAPIGLPSPLPTTVAAVGRSDQIAAAPAEGVSSTSGRVLGGFVLAALLGGAALASRNSPTTAASGAQGRGVGRFVRPRDEPPLSI